MKEIMTFKGLKQNARMRILKRIKNYCVLQTRIFLPYGFKRLKYAGF